MSALLPPWFPVIRDAVVFYFTKKNNMKNLTSSSLFATVVHLRAFFYLSDLVAFLDGGRLGRGGLVHAAARKVE